MLHGPCIEIGYGLFLLVQHMRLEAWIREHLSLM